MARRCERSRNFVYEGALAHWGGCCAKNKLTEFNRLDDLVPGICSPLRKVIVFFHFWTNYDLENEQVVRVCLVYVC